ncbi:MAG: hypothetical protein KDA96_00845, partial [Planctomycetaceae bacterium]|nr:hypothetical protein [Planctomycetaceae bacterium]
MPGETTYAATLIRSVFFSKERHMWMASCQFVWSYLLYSIGFPGRETVQESCEPVESVVVETGRF